MHLLVNGLVLPIAQLGTNFLVLEKAVKHPPADADILVRIDGDEKRWTVRLPEGLQPEERRVPIAKFY